MTRPVRGASEATTSASDDAGRGIRADGANAGERVDLDGLLCALVLTPATYSRNRFFELYRDPEVVSVRRRASRLRSLLRQMSSAPDARWTIEPRSDGDFELTLEVVSLGYRRLIRLSALERHLVLYVIGRARGGVAAESRTAIEEALARLARGGFAGERWG
jgi:hypothetical protein